MTKPRTGTTKSGWCLSFGRKYHKQCRIRDCSCPCGKHPWDKKRTVGKRKPPKA